MANHQNHNTRGAVKKLVNVPLSKTTLAAPDTDAEHGEDFGKVVNVLSEESGIDEETIKARNDRNTLSV